MFKFELKTHFKTTIGRLEANGWKIEKPPYADAGWAIKKINDKEITTIYENECLFVVVCDDSAGLDFASAVCEELKKLEVE